MSSQETTDFSQITCLKTLSEKLDPASMRLLPKEKQDLLYAYLRWENAARVSCGPVFIHQAYKSPSPPTRGSNTPTDTSSRHSL